MKFVIALALATLTAKGFAKDSVCIDINDGDYNCAAVDRASRGTIKILKTIAEGTSELTFVGLGFTGTNALICENSNAVEPQGNDPQNAVIKKEWSVVSNADQQAVHQAFTAVEPKTGKIALVKYFGINILKVNQTSFTFMLKRQDALDRGEVTWFCEQSAKLPTTDQN